MAQESERSRSAFLAIAWMLAGTLLLTAAVVFWIPMVPCPACVEHEYAFSTSGTPKCPVCNDHPKMSLYQNWQARRWITAFFRR